MIRIDFDEDAIVLDYDLKGDAQLNAKQLAGIMGRDERFAKLIAMAIPWYQYLQGSGSKLYAQKVMDVVENDYEEYLDSLGRDAF